MEKISATIITCNEKTNIEGALQGLAWADEIVVVDSGSADGTLEICGRYPVRIFHRDWTGYVDQKNYAAHKASHNWIFSLDSDERPSAPLVSEIDGLRRSGFQFSGYRIPRVAFFMGRWIRHGEWYPDYQLRLFDRRTGSWQGGRVHESVLIRGRTGFLSSEIHHYTYRNLSDYLRRLEIYSTLSAQDYLQKGRRSSAWKMIANPPVNFLKGYFLRRGFLDGVPGLMVAVMAATSVYFKYAKLYELQKANSR